MKKLRERKASVSLTASEFGWIIGALKVNIRMAEEMRLRAAESNRAELSEIISENERIVKKLDAAFQKSTAKLRTP